MCLFRYISLLNQTTFFRMLVKFLHNKPEKFTSEKATKAQKGSRDIAVLFL
jgi:hypothetical protein